MSALTPLDMHIEVLQGLQKLDSAAQDIFGPEEIDFHLNKQQNRFIAELFNKSFQNEQLRLDLIQNIIVRNRKLIAFDNTLEVGLNTSPILQSDGQGVYGRLPSDYVHLISDRSNLVLLDNPCAPATYTVNTVTYAEKVVVLKFPEPVLDVPTGSYYIDLILDVDNTEVYKTSFNVNDTDLALGSTIVDPEYKSILIQDILEKINVSGIPNMSNSMVFWENYRGTYYPNSFIFVSEPSGLLSDSSFPTTIRATTKTSAGVNQSTQNGVLTSTDYTIVNKDGIITDTAYKRQTVQNKLAKADELYEFSKNKFYKPSVIEPHSTIANNLLYVYGSSSSIITDLVIDYVRKPRQISLSLNKSCELSETAARIVVDNTIEYMKLVTENPAYQGILQDNQIKNQNNLRNG